jgi:hypothetical protein
MLADEQAKLFAQHQKVVAAINAKVPETLRGKHVVVVSGDTHPTFKFEGNTFPMELRYDSYSRVYKLGYRGRGRVGIRKDGTVNADLVKGFWENIEHLIAVAKMNRERNEVRSASAKLVRKAQEEVGGPIENSYSNRIEPSASDADKVVLKLSIHTTVDPEVAVKAWKALAELGLVK